VTTTIDVRRTGRARAAWAAAHGAVPGVARWERIAARVVPLTLLPSSLWRIAACTFHAPIVRGGTDIGATPSNVPGLSIEAYAVLLSIVSELLGFAAVGLVASWGQSVPRWVPWLGGRRVPRMVAVVPAALGASVLTVLWTWVAITAALGRRVDGSVATGTALLGFRDWRGLLTVAAYAPLLLWGPLLAALTVGYWRRRGRTGSMAG
jgi:hypothetical protein